MERAFMGLKPILKQLEEICDRDASSAERMLFITDGTVTEALEALTLEPIQLIKLSQKIEPADASAESLDPEPDERFLYRKILLKGSTSGRHYLHATSVIAYQRLSLSFQDQLLHAEIPLGKLWKEHKVATFKEFLERRRIPAGDLSDHFGCKADDLLLARTYLVRIENRPLARIIECFPRP